MASSLGLAANDLLAQAPRAYRDRPQAVPAYFRHRRAGPSVLVTVLVLLIIVVVSFTLDYVLARTMI